MTKTVTKEVEVPVEVPVEVEVPVVPAECLAALDDADALHGLAAEFATITADTMSLSAEAVPAAIAWDAAELERITAELQVKPGEIEAVTAKVNASTYGTNSEACRAAQ